jgi:hypothetical protein
VVLGLFCLVSAQPAAAQRYRYMDDAGNIRFVDSLSEVPVRYREQINPPTPTPILDKQALAAKKREEQRLAREKMMEERKRKVEERRKEAEARRVAEKEKKRLQREQQTSSFERPK